MNLDFKIFRFEKQDCCYAELTEEGKKEENINILNGVNFARKVIVTQECDFLLLDEILGLVDMWNCYSGYGSRYFETKG